MGKLVSALKEIELLRKIEISLIHNFAFFTVHKFCHGQPLSLLAPGVKKSSYSTVRRRTTIKQKAVL